MVEILFSPLKTNQLCVTFVRLSKYVPARVAPVMLFAEFLQRGKIENAAGNAWRKMVLRYFYLVGVFNILHILYTKHVCL